MTKEEASEVILTVRLPERLALPLAQLVKRITFGGVRECAVDDDETREMLAALEQVRSALAEKGYAPR